MLTQMGTLKFILSTEEYAAINPADSESRNPEIDLVFGRS